MGMVGGTGSCGMHIAGVDRAMAAEGSMTWLTGARVWSIGIGADMVSKNDEGWLTVSAKLIGTASATLTGTSGSAGGGGGGGNGNICI